MSEENKLQKYGVVSISRGGEVWDEVQKNNSGNYYLVEDVDLVIEKYKEENEKLEITIRADRIDSNTLEERMSEATHYTWLDGRIESVERENEKLKDALLIYGSHKTGCACLSDPEEEYGIPCTCGFSEALGYGRF